MEVTLHEALYQSWLGDKKTCYLLLGIVADYVSEEKHDGVEKTEDFKTETKESEEDDEFFVRY